MVNILIAMILIAVRLPLLIIIILFGLIIIIFYPREITKFKNIHFKIMMIWMNVLSKIIGIKVIIEGKPDYTADLYVSNHVTYLDIIILNRILPVNFIAKKDIASWPVIGYLASKTGTLFIKRGDSRESNKMIDQMKERFHLKRKVIFFPEGKIGSGSIVKKFHSKLFKSIENENISIQPIAIRYPKRYPKVLSYDEDISKRSMEGSIISIYMNIMGRPKSHVILSFLEKIETRDFEISLVSNMLATRINSSLRDLDN